MTSHITHLAVPSLCKPVSQAALVFAWFDSGDANLLKAQRLATRLDLVGETPEAGWRELRFWCLGNTHDGLLADHSRLVGPLV